MFCTNCGKKLEAGALFCTECGTKVQRKPDLTKAEVTETAAEPIADIKHSGADNVPLGALPFMMKDAAPDIDFENYAPRVKTKKSGVLPFVIILIVLVLVLAAAIWYFVFYNPQTQATSQTEVTATPVATATVEPKRTELIDMATIYNLIAEDTNNAQISVCISDLKNGKVYSTENATQTMSASALINVPITYVIHKGVEKGTEFMDRGAVFTYRSDGRGNIKKESNGELMELGYLVEQMLRYSDNNATNSLIDEYGKNNIGRLCAEYGYKGVEVQRYLGEVSETKDNYVTAQDITMMVSEMYFSRNGLGKDFLEDNFAISDSIRSSGIGKYLPKNITFLNHNGITSTIYNETAIIKTDKAEYIITVLTNYGKGEESAEKVADISDYVYTCLNCSDE